MHNRLATCGSSHLQAEATISGFRIPDSQVYTPCISVAARHDAGRVTERYWSRRQEISRPSTLQTPVWIASSASKREFVVMGTTENVIGPAVSGPHLVVKDHSQQTQ